jgi:hypothetical protein
VKGLDIVSYSGLSPANGRHEKAALRRLFQYGSNYMLG